MNREITLQLPEDVFNGAINLAQVSGFAIDELMGKFFKALIKPAQSMQQNRFLIQRLFALLPDDEILALANLKMPAENLSLFTKLIATQKEQELTVEEANALEALGIDYDKINLARSYALIEAIKRKLMAPPAET